MHLYRRSYTHQGKRREVRTWTVEFTDHRGGRRRLTLYPNKRVSERAARRIVRLAEAARAGDPPDGELVRWVNDLPGELREQLVAWGLVDERRAMAARPLRTLIGAWRQSLEAKGSSGRHVQETVRRVEQAFEACGFHRVADIADAPLAEWLGSRVGPKRRPGSKAPRGWSARRYNAHVQSCRQFVRWLYRTGVVGEELLRTLSRRNEARDRRHVRRALSAEKLRSLIQAAHDSGQEVCGMPGPRRALLYCLAAETGLRAGEIARLRVGDLREDPGGRRYLAVHAAYTKAGRDDVVYPRPALAAWLAEEARGRLPRAQLVEGAGSGHTAEMVRKDLARIGEPYVDEHGEVFDFHALRHSFGTLAGRSGHPRTTQELMRHHSAEMTARYTHAVREDVASALERLPDLTPGRDPKRTRAAVGETPPLGVKLGVGSAQPRRRGTTTDEVPTVQPALKGPGGGVEEGFKIRSPQGGGGSSPPSGTTRKPGSHDNLRDCAPTAVGDPPPDDDPDWGQFCGWAGTGWDDLRRAWGSLTAEQRAAVLRIVRGEAAP